MATAANGISAKDDTSYNHTVRKRRSDETLRHDQRSSALLRAAAEGQAPRVRYLLHLGADLDHSDDDGFTALHHATLSGFEDVAEVLLEAGSDVNAQSLDCGTPLHLATIKARKNVIGLLLKYRGNAIADSRALGSPLHCASFVGDVEIVKVLCECGAEVRRLGILGLTMLRLFGPITLLTHDPFEPTACIPFFECEPIHIAARMNMADVIVALVNLEACSNALARSWWTSPTDKLFFDEPANIEKDDQMTPLLYAADFGHLNACKALLDLGARIDAQNRGDETALMWAAAAGRSDSIQMLYENKASLEIRDGYGQVALHYATYDEQGNCVRTLCENGAKMDLQENDGYTPLHFAAQEGRHAVVRAFLDADASVNMQDRNGQTPLHLSVIHGRLYVSKMLMEAGGDKSILDNEGRTALEILQAKTTTDNQRSSTNKEMRTLLEDRAKHFSKSRIRVGFDESTQLNADIRALDLRNAIPDSSEMAVARRNTESQRHRLPHKSDLTTSVDASVRSHRLCRTHENLPSRLHSWLRISKRES